MIHLNSHSDTRLPFVCTRHHAGAAFMIGVDERLADPGVRRRSGRGGHWPAWISRTGRSNISPSPRRLTSWNTASTS